VKDDQTARLSDAHLVALRLDAEGLDEALIARVLDIDVRAVPTLLEIARRKQRADRLSNEETR
jgi:hypothetical protein